KKIERSRLAPDWHRLWPGAQPAPTNLQRAQSSDRWPMSDSDFSYRQDHPRRASPWTYFGPILALLAIVVGLAWLVANWLGQGGNNDPNAPMRAVVPRGDLAADEQSTIELFKKASPSVVYITSIAVVQ